MADHRNSLEGVSQRDVAMRNAMQHESVEALGHQLEVERDQKATMDRSDYYLSLGLVGFVFGIGCGIGGLRPRFTGGGKKK